MSMRLILKYRVEYQCAEGTALPLALFRSAKKSLYFQVELAKLPLLIQQYQPLSNSLPVTSLIGLQWAEYIIPQQ